MGLGGFGPGLQPVVQSYRGLIELSLRQGMTAHLGLVSHSHLAAHPNSQAACRHEYQDATDQQEPSTRGANRAPAWCEHQAIGSYRCSPACNGDLVEDDVFQRGGQGRMGMGTVSMMRTCRLPVPDSTGI